MAPLGRGARMLGRVVERRVGGQPGKQRCLGEGQAAGALAEVRPRRLLDPVGAVAEVDRVQVREQDAVLGPPLLELPGERRLSHLAGDRLLVADVCVLDELLRDRGATLDDALRAHILPERAHDAASVDAVVLVEAAILDRDDRLPHDRRDVVDVLDEDAALLAAEHGEHGAAVRGVDDAVDLGVLRRGVEKGDLARDGANQTECERRPREQHQDGEHGEETQLTNPAPLARCLRASS